MLGISSNALYLREPFTQTYLKTKRQEDPAYFEFDLNHPPHGYDITARNVFRGIPLFGKVVTSFPEQWTLLSRSRKRIVFKEVNPFMLEWLIVNFRPRIIYLVRHPAANAWSFSRMGWQVPQLENRISKETLEQTIPFYKECIGSFWTEQTALQAYLLRQALHYTEQYPDMRLVQFEDLCADPLTGFQDLYQFAGLKWDHVVEQKIRMHVHPEKISLRHHSTYRDSMYEATKWKKEVPPEIIAQIKDTWLSFKLPFYQNDW